MEMRLTEISDTDELFMRDVILFLGLNFIAKNTNTHGY